MRPLRPSVLEFDVVISRYEIESTADMLRRDPVYADGIKLAMLESGLAAILGFVLDESKLDPHRPCPVHWKAMQIAIFDNGEPVERRKRPKIARTSARYGGNIMVWTRDTINFKIKSHVAWRSNIYLWTADEARQIVRDLRDEGYLDQETVELINQVTEGSGDDLRFSVPLLKLGTGTRWMRSHLVITTIADERPRSMAIVFPDAEPFATSEPMVDYLADGAQLTGNTILQARLARDPSLGQWATEIIR